MPQKGNWGKGRKTIRVGKLILEGRDWGQSSKPYHATSPFVDHLHKPKLVLLHKVLHRLLEAALALQHSNLFSY